MKLDAEAVGEDEITGPCAVNLNQPDAPQSFIRQQLGSRAAGDRFVERDLIVRVQLAHEADERVKIGGLILTDNTLWSGRVLDGESREESTRGVIRYDEEAFNAPDLFTTIIPLRDGVAMSLKLGDEGRRKK